jgi:uncharacterized protein YceK
MRRLFISCAVLVAISGCGTIPLTHATASSAPPAADAKTSAAKTSAATSGSPRQRAEADAASILASFVPPPGARKLSAAPSLDGGVLGHPQETPASLDFVDDASWWQFPLQFPSAVLSWEAAYVSRRFTFTGSGTGLGTTFENWDLPPVAGVLDSRWLVVSALSDGAGGTDVRVEGEVSYTPARPAASYIPATAVHAVVVTAVPGPNDQRKPPAPLVITDPVKVRNLVALVNGLPLSLPGVYSCPAYDGGGVRLTFLAKGGEGKATNGPVIKTAVRAVALATTSGCGGVQLTIAGTQTGLGGGSSAAGQALAISGLHWTFYTYPR